MGWRVTLLMLICGVILGTMSSSSGLDNGLGTQYSWSESLPAALEEARSRSAPILLMIHKSWCGACKALKPKFAASESLLKLSQHFVMVNLMDEDEPSDSNYSPDGGYIPRILFLTPNGHVLENIYNEMGSLQHKYFYSQPEDIVKSMKKVLTVIQEQSNMVDNEEL
ncbi:thioredoxin domain-containing protein 12-like [Arctopsyche grandis]|uniref:thioredoxin domain-containing protein 12-like n=1 Tax=Arctopsyche grandis TaxID=121162 RepID=UPI00406D7258